MRLAAVRAPRASFLRVVFLVLLLLFLVSSRAWAQNENETVGFQSHHLFEGGYFGENVDILNGGVNLTAPVGPKYQLNQNFGYQLQIAYGSKIWDKGEWDNNAYLYRRGGLGLGGLLNFGRIYRDVAYTAYQTINSTTGQVNTNYDYQCTWYYVTADGNEHVLPGNYRPDQNILTCSDSPPAGYTIDDTFYYFYDGSGTLAGWNGSGTAPTLVIETPDRIKYTFGQFVPISNFESAIPGGSTDPALRNYNRDFGGWYVTRIEDERAPGTVWVNIEYDTRAGFQHLISRITDSDGREILLTNECQPDTSTISGCKQGPYSGNAADRPATRIKSILLPAFKGNPAVDNTRRAQYDFGYEWRPIYNLFYPTDATHAQPQNILRTLSFPSITKRSGPAERYQLLLDYDTFGELGSRTLPTGAPPSGSFLGSGTVLYTYNDYDFLGTGIYGFSYNPTSATRQLTSKSVCLGGSCETWRYVRDATNATNPMLVMVTDPFGNDTLYYYHASIQDSQGRLGFCMEDGWAPEWNDGLNYRIEYYQGTGAGRTLLRMETRDYDSDPGNTCSLGQHSHNNVRVTKVVTTFLDQGGRQSTTAYSEWDGVGHFKVMTELGTDVTGSRVTRTEYVGADPGRFRYREIGDGMRILWRRDNTYDGAGNLALTIDRLSLPAASGTPSSSTAAPGDIVTAYQFDNRANISVKEMGNQGAVQSSGVWRANGASYHISYSWQGGYLKTKTFYDFSSGQDFYWNAIGRNRDGNTGLIYMSFDTAGIETDYRYDDLGRVTDIVPRSPAGAYPQSNPDPEYATQIEYVGVKSTTVRQGDPNVMGSDFTCSGTTGDYIETCYDYDDLGRLAKTRKRPYNPLLAYPYQTTSYDIVGRTTFLSEWLWPTNTTCSANPMPASCGTTYDLHDPDNPTQTDPFGRVRRVTAADGKVTRTDYFGQSNKVTVFAIQGATGPFDATTKYLKDVWGRLVKVEMPQGGGSDAFYTYDLRDNLIQVDLANKTTGTRQSRLFQYDALNRLYSSWNPENGTTEVLGYDPMGNVTEQVDFSGNHLLFTYDGAGRLTTEQRKDDRKPTQVVTLRQNVYDEYGTGIISANCLSTQFGCSGGRLTSSTDFDDRGPVLSETYAYTGLNGRPGTLTPIFSGAPAVGSLVYAYNNFGLQSQLDYPGGPANGYPLSTRSVYSNGYLTQVYDASTLGAYGVVQQYNAAGGMQVVGTYGGVDTNIIPDGRNRPAKITIGLGVYDPGTDTYLSGTYYKSGAYQYDGAGNIASIGQSSYGYDAASRLVQATELVFGDTITRTHAYGYDDFGNMTSDTFSDGTIRQDDTFVMSSAVNNQIAQHTSKITDLSTGKTLSNSTKTLSYDLRGNLFIGDSQTYDYDSRNRMVALRLISGNQEIARYAYDAASVRVSKEDTARGVVTYYVHDAQGKLMSEFRRTRGGSSGVPEWSKHYVYLGDRLVAMQENAVPGPVGGLSATTASGNVTVSWKANPSTDNVTSYKVYRTFHPANSFSSWTLLTTTTSLSFSDTTVSDGTVYDYVATAVGATEGYPSDPLPVQAASTAGPLAPTGLASLAGDRRIDLTWSANASTDFVIGYNLYRDLSTAALNTSLITATYFADLNLVNGTVHSYVVKAVNVWGVASPASASVSATPRDYGRPGPPRNVSAASDCTSAAPQIKLQWSPPYGATDIAKYSLYRSPEFPVTGCTSNCSKDVGNVTLYADPSVSIGTVYQYWVVAVDTAGNLSSRSLGVVATPRNVSSAVTVPATPVATASDGKVTIRVTYPLPVVYPTLRIYRKLNAVQDCQAYQLLGTISTGLGAYCPNNVCYQDFTDSGVPNAAAYDYVVTNVNSQGAESGYSKPALAIPVPSLLSYVECVEDLRGSTLASWKDGAELPASLGSNYRRLKVRVQRPGIPEYQPLTSSTAGGSLGFLRGYHLYDFYTPLYWGWGDESRIKPVAVDLEKGQCVIQTTASCYKQSDCPSGQTCSSVTGYCEVPSGFSCSEYDSSNATCPSGLVCDTPPYPHCAGRSDYGCNSDGICSFMTNDYCTDTPVIAGYCAGSLYWSSPQVACMSDSDCSGYCITAFPTSYCSNDVTHTCSSSNECNAGSCRNVHSYDGYLNQFADGGFNTFTSALQYWLQVGGGGCLAVKGVYTVYANGQWQRVESGYSDNFSISPGNPFVRCADSTPALYNGYIFPGCRAPSDPPPQVIQAPAVTSTSADTLTVAWSSAGVCRPTYYESCSPGCTSSCTFPLCPSGQVCVANNYYSGDPALSNDPGHCVMATPVACDAQHACPLNQTCETSGLDGYYIYATEKQQSGTSTPINPRYHFAPNRPAATVDKNTTQYTFKGIAPNFSSGSSAIPTQFSFRIAPFANGGKIDEMSPASGYVTPMASTATMPAPQSLHTGALATGGVSLSWLPGAAYNTNTTTLSNYQVFRSTTPGGPYALLGTTLSTGWFDSTAQPNVDYYYVVKALSTRNALSDPSPEVAARAVPSTLPPDQPLRPPASFNAQAPDPNHPTDWSYIGLSWCPNNGSEGVTGYRIYRSQQQSGPYTLITPNQDVSPLCLDGKHRCEITNPSAGTFSISTPTTSCVGGRYSTCQLIDKTVLKAPLDGNYPNQSTNYVYYYVVTAMKRDVSGSIISESGYSLENQGWTNYCTGSQDSCGRFDPDVIPLLPCILPQTASLKASPAVAGSADGGGRTSNDPDIAPYRVIGGARRGGGGGSPPPPPPVSLPTPAAFPRMILFHLDHLGTPRVLTNSSGFVVSTHHYMPFGDERPVQPQNSTNTRQFAGEERDAESGLDYMAARYYGSSLNRFMSPDPLAGHLLIPQTLNRYVYAGNNPIRFNDSTGLDFYLQCSDKGTDECDENGHAGQTTTDENGNETFTPTIVSEEDGELVDNNGDTYTAEVDGEGVHLTNQNSGDTNTGTWQKNSDPVSFTQETGDLAGFTFKFTTNPNTGQDASGTFTFAGTRKDADTALQNAGLKPVRDIQPGDNFKSSGGPDKDNVAHFIIKSGSNTPVSGKMHTGESAGAAHVLPAIADFFEWAFHVHPGGDK